MNKTKLILLIILLVIFSSIATAVIYFNNEVYQIRSLPMMVEVKNKIGIGLYGGEQLNFGIVPRGGASALTFNITSSKDVNILVLKKGNIAGFITLSENNFLLRKNELKRIETSLRIPMNAEFGNYSGRLIIILGNV